MAPAFLVELVLLTVAYRVVDGVLREGLGAALMARLGLGSSAAWAVVWVALGLTASVFTGWAQVPQGDAVRIVGAGLGCLLAWKATTKDIDVVTGEAWWLERGLLAVSAVLVWFEPAMLLPTLALLTRPFGLWQHHATLPMRDLQAVLAWLLLVLPATSLPVVVEAGGIELFTTAGTLFWFLLVVHVSHYLITALAKAWLGPWPWSWVWENKVHHLAASAWSWGWARFVPWERWLRLIGWLRTVERPMQAYAFCIELLAPLALLSPPLGIGATLAWSAFHVGVFTTSGLLFWDWIAANLALGLALMLLPPDVLALAFGPWMLLAGLVFMGLFPLRHKLWRPMPLGWWDTPLTQRMHWLAHGRSGTVYALTNGFMDPHERIYGKVHGCFLTPVPAVTYHLGEVYKHDLRDAIRGAGPTLEGLAPVRVTYGILPRSDALAEAHRRYLRAFFTAVNAGARKHVLPGPLRVLKAPGGQIFYWAELPAYRGQEPVDRVSLRYREEYFDGQRLVRLMDEEVEVIEITPLPAGSPVPREPTPKELDMFLLGFAAGKLVDIPDFAGGFVGGDDGAKGA